MSRTLVGGNSNPGLNLQLREHLSCRGELTKALENLEEALQACPLEKGGAIQQIRRHIAAVEGELKRKLALNGGGNMLTSTQGRKLTDGDVRQRA